MNEVFLQLGSNLGDRKAMIINSIIEINSRVGKVINKSKIYETAPWGVNNQSNYLNQVIKIITHYSSDMVLKKVLQIENIFGRKRLKKWGDRIIDIDILFYNNDLINKFNLCVPHKHLHERKFVLIPLCDIASDYIHPKFDMKVSSLLVKCKDQSYVAEYS